jgi:hypothetical protein
MTMTHLRTEDLKARSIKPDFASACIKKMQVPL